MYRTVFGFIWNNSRRDQLLILLMTVISFPFLYYSLELPKLIVNNAIDADGISEWRVPFLGMEVGQISYLFVLSGFFLALMIINGVFKYYINVYRGLVGERMLQRLRYELYQQVIRFQLPRFKKVSQGEIIPMITAEVEPVGGFAGDAFALPAFQGGQLMVYMTFIFMQDPILGAAAVSLFPIQAYVIPKLQKHVNRLGKQRVRAVRKLADKVGESVGAATEIHANDTSVLHRADISSRLTGIYTIRFEIFRRKFFIKFLNNFLNQLTPFFFYSIGGYLVIVGRLELGALVAILAAYKDVASPWRELLTYYQRVEDVRIKYDQVVEQFNPPDLKTMERLDGEPPFEELPDAWTLNRVSFGEDPSNPVVDGVSGEIASRGTTAIVGKVGSGKDELLALLAGLVEPTGGNIRLGEQDLETVPESVTGRRIAYVTQQTQLLTDTMWGNIVYGLKHRPLQSPERAGEALSTFKRNQSIAKAAGTNASDMEADWIDYEAAGVAGPKAMVARILDVLEQVELSEDVYRMGLSGPLPTDSVEGTAERVLSARHQVRQRLYDEPKLAKVVELFDPDRFNESATVAENLLFGVPVAETFQPENLADSKFMLETLGAVGLTDKFLEIGKTVAETMIELFADLPPGHEFFEQFSFIASEELPDYQPIITKVDRSGFDGLDAVERSKLMALPFRLIPSRHRLGLIDEAVQEKIVEARQRFQDKLPDRHKDAVAFFDVDKFNPAASIQDNILFGKVRYGQSANQDRALSLIREMVEARGLRESVIVAGLDQSVGIGGARLALALRQKLALARALVKRPQVMILNAALSALDGSAQLRIYDRLRREPNGLIVAPHRMRVAETADDIIVMQNGKIVERGVWADLSQKPGGVLSELLLQDG